MKPLGVRRIDMDFRSTQYINMKAIQIMMDEELLKRLDATPEVRKNGRSEVLRRAAAEYLARRRQWEIRERYRKAYKTDLGLDDEFAGWEEQGTWPDE